MEKSKYGFNGAVYPLLILCSILFSQIWVAIAIFGFVLVVETSQVIQRRALHATLFAFVLPVLNLLTGQLWKFWRYVEWQLREISEYGRLEEGAQNFFKWTTNIFSAIGSVFFCAFVVYVIFMGILPLMKGENSKLALDKVADKLYGVLPSPAQQYAPPPQGGYAPPPQQQYAPPPQQYAPPPGQQPPPPPAQ